MVSRLQAVVFCLKESISLLVLYECNSGKNTRILYIYFQTKNRFALHFRVISSPWLCTHHGMWEFYVSTWIWEWGRARENMCIFVSLGLCRCAISRHYLVHITLLATLLWGGYDGQQIVVFCLKENWPIRVLCGLYLVLFACSAMNRRSS